MGISAIEDSYEEAKRRAKLFYQGIGRVWCPALKDYIAFDERGFRHLIQKGRRFRMKSEQKRRFALLVHVRAMFESAPIFSIDRKQEGKFCACYWKFKDSRHGFVVTIIVRQIGDGIKHFLSVYGKNKNPRQKA